MNSTTVSAGMRCSLFALFMLAGCQGQSDEAAYDETAAEEVPTESIFLVIGHPVTDYDAWKAAYDAGAPLREASRLSHVGIYRVEDDTNFVWVSNAVSDLEEAHAFTQLEELRTNMEEAGVAGEPQVIFMRQLRDTGAGADTAHRLMIGHPVADVESWTAAFDTHASARTDAGLVDMGIFEDTEAEGLIYLMFGVTDAEAARAFLDSEDLKNAMQDAGVTGEPNISWVRVAD